MAADTAELQRLYIESMFQYFNFDALDEAEEEQARLNAAAADNSGDSTTSSEADLGSQGGVTFVLAAQEDSEPDEEPVQDRSRGQQDTSTRSAALEDRSCGGQDTSTRSATLEDRSCGGQDTPPRSPTGQDGSRGGVAQFGCGNPVFLL